MREVGVVCCCQQELTHADSCGLAHWEPKLSSQVATAAPIMIHIFMPA